MLPVNQFGANYTDFCTLSHNKAMLLLLLVAVTSLVHSAPVINVSLPLDCEDVYILIKSSDENATIPDGVYTIYPAGPDHPVKVFCDMGCKEDDNHQDGRWTVIQRRIDGNVSFYQPWKDYKNGFGDASGEYWLGLENMFLMTNTEKYQLRVDMEDFERGSAYALYTTFFIGSESNSYTLNIGGYINGGAGDSLFYVNGRPFSTFDKDPTGYCADTNGGGFWYNYYYWYYYSYYNYYNYGYCHIANPNGLYKLNNVNAVSTGSFGKPGKVATTL
ncbi:microfibril-associated glycoprotein 4-like [Silurus meridionalis]|uniref:microfibril-associated glycoprotein 4-like n=1 Tax=Silurus meridionalis TaxID=175797 RepID=UPI001EEB2D0A|nr:microfibril-associated glycoprotein 4-like [Silurus meridionalis]